MSSQLQSSSSATSTNFSLLISTLPFALSVREMVKQGLEVVLLPANEPSNGNTKVKVEPSPSLDCTDIFPPSFSTIILLSGRPRP